MGLIFTVKTGWPTGLKRRKDRDMYKFMNNPYRLPMFDADKGGGAGGTSAEDNSEEAGGDDQDGDEDSDEDGEEEAEKKFTQKDLDDAVKKRLARAKKRWQREQAGSEKSAQDDEKDESHEENKKTETKDPDLEKERKRNEKLNMRLACYEAGVQKDYVKDVTALARSYMEDDEDMDFEDAIDAVLKRYPQFKGESDSEEKGSWGQRQKGKAKKDKSMEDEISDVLFGN